MQAKPTATETPTLLIPAEYRTGKLDTFTFAAANGRPERSIVRAIHSVEVNDKALEFTEVLPENTPLHDWKAPVSKGTKVTLGVSLESASCLSIGPNGKPKASKGLWRIRVLTITPSK